MLMWGMDEDYFSNIEEHLIANSPHRKDKIKEAASYLRKHMADIAIYATDPSAGNGGATEPHVSHVLSARLSSRPKGWSEKTLQFFAPILANGPDISIEEDRPVCAQTVALEATERTKNKWLNCKGGDLWQSTIAVTQIGKRTELYKALHGLATHYVC